MSKILLGVTGSVAAIRCPALADGLIKAGHEVKVAATEASLHFFDPTGLPAGVLHRDADEWPEAGYRRGDPVLHIQLRQWADVLLIAPLDAHTLAKLALGLADNLLTCLARAWDLARPTILAPAMNTLMWNHPATARHLRQVATDRGVDLPDLRDPDAVVARINESGGPLRVVGPVAKTLACGDAGMGGMAEVADVVAAVR
jgi:phosphopantothenoylcysteine decarboxylase